MQTGRECIYCGSEKPQTRDHVPPKGLYGEPLPDNLFTVPSCRSCNQEFGQDEEYFRQVVLARIGTEHDDANEAWEKVKRSLTKDRAAKWKTEMFRNLDMVPVRTPSGLVVGRAPSFQVDLRRIRAVWRKMVMGLYFREKGKRVPNGHSVNVWEPTQFSPIEQHQLGETFGPAIEAERKEIGNDTLVYSAAFAIDRPDAGAFYMRFYDAFELLGMTFPEELHPEEPQEE